MTQTPAGPTEPDVVDILTRDHREMVELIGRIEGAPDSSMRRELADTVIAEVMRHAVAEEMYVYPIVEKHVPDGKEEIEHDKGEHAEIVDLMKELEGIDAADPRFIEVVRDLEGKLRHHANDEETDQFPKLRANIPYNELIDLGKNVENAKKVAPTRPHPHAPHSELFHKTVGAGVGMVDRLRDRLRRPEPGPAPGARGMRLGDRPAFDGDRSGARPGPRDGRERAVLGNPVARHSV